MQYCVFRLQTINDIKLVFSKNTYYGTPGTRGSCKNTGAKYRNMLQYFFEQKVSSELKVNQPYSQIRSLPS